ncbi:hypothetical protein [uncultured Oscillibacter sp.]|uniref:hypothetical protein n=1 Tax=uncultured Oscillibacter sp. TaxID=876091 RepID=UPI00262AF2C2|nr:hypothetical protein [uncultured Oscillibacter sp.]
MSTELAAQIGLIRNDMARLESILPAQMIQRVLSGADAGVSSEAVAAYREIRIFKHTRGWLLKALRRVLMPTRLVTRGVFSRRVRLSLSAAMYALFLGIVWYILLSNDVMYGLACFLTWVVVILAALAPYIAACFYLRKNRDVYRYIRKLEEASVYGLE